MFEFNGLVDLPWWGYVLAALCMTHITIVGVTVFLHRHQAHRALEMHPAVSHFFRCWMWLTTGMSTREWVAVHRKHHDKVESPEDPHSPVQVGIHKVLWEGSELYAQEALCAQTLRKYGKGTPDDWLEQNVYAHGNYGVGTMLVTNVLLFGPIGVTIWAVQMIWIPVFAAGIINGLGHWFGYRNFDTPRDRSTNLLPWGILIGGEELHNNHHAYSGSARMSARWWEFDIGWMYIRLLECLGLARVDRQRLVPRPKMNLSKQMLDMETVRAVLRSHGHVMSDYARRVVDRVCREELNREELDQASTPARRTRVRRIAKLLRENRLDHVGHQVLSAYPALGSVYRQRQALSSLLQGQASGEVVLGKLRCWCDEAEHSGVAALTEFASKLKGYTLSPAA